MDFNKSLLNQRINPKKKPKRNKYGAKKSEYDGVVYHSKKEAKYAKELDIKRSATGNDKVIKVERQVPYSIEINDIHICRYMLDFRVTYPNRVELIDVKGVKTTVYKLKKKMVEAYYGVDIIEV